MDYCNSLYAGLPACDIAQLQSVQNAGTRLFGGVSKYDSVTPVLRDVIHWLPIKERINFKIGVLTYVVHWLPIKERINFKIGVLTYKALNGLASSYLSEMLVPVAVNPALRRNRSAERGDLTVPRAKNTNYGHRSFAIAAPTRWNSFLLSYVVIIKIIIPGQLVVCVFCTLQGRFHNQR